MLAVCGIEGDYDGEVLTLPDAVTAISGFGVHAALYSSPSSTPDKPRWRALCPLAHEHGPVERRALVGRLNRMLDGVLAPERFTLSQSYYIGRAVDAAHYEAQEVRSDRYIDEADDVAPLYPINGAGAGNPLPPTR